MSWDDTKTVSDLIQPDDWNDFVTTFKNHSSSTTLHISNKIATFDTNTYIKYNDSSKQFEFFINNTKVAVINSDGRMFVKAITQVGGGNLP